MTYLNETKCSQNDNNFANFFRDDMMIFVVFIFVIFSLSLRNSNFSRYVFRFKIFQTKFHFVESFVSFNSNFNFKNISISQNYKTLRSAKISWTNYQISHFRNYFFIQFNFIIRLKNTLRRETRTFFFYLFYHNSYFQSICKNHLCKQWIQKNKKKTVKKKQKYEKTKKNNKTTDKKHEKDCKKHEKTFSIHKENSSEISKANDEC